MPNGEPVQRYHVGAHHRGGGSVLEARLFFGRYIRHLAIERQRHSPVDSLQRLPVPRDVPRTNAAAQGESRSGSSVPASQGGLLWGIARNGILRAIHQSPAGRDQVCGSCR